MKNRTWRFIAITAVAAIVLAACSSGGDSTTSGDSQRRGQATSETYQAAADNSVPYPLAQMKAGAWLERRLLKENLLRQNDAHRIAYVTLLNVQGQPIVQYTIQGMVFDLNSQMSTTDKVKDWCGNGCTSFQVTRSPGDNGTYGPEPAAIGFFTTEGVEIKWNGLYLESDSPQDITTKPLIVYDASSAKASVSAGGVGNVNNGGIKTGAAASGG